MTKYEFLERLENNLGGIDYQLRQETLRFYEDYIENSNLGEEEVIASLKSPEAIAREIKGEHDQNESAKTEENHHDYYQSEPGNFNGHETRTNRQTRNLLLILAIVFIFAMGIGGIGGLFGIVFGIFGGFFGLLVGLFVFGAASLYWAVTTIIQINNTMDLGNILIHIGLFLVYLSFTFLWLALFLGMIHALPTIIKFVKETAQKLLAWLRGLLK